MRQQHLQQLFHDGRFSGGDARSSVAPSVHAHPQIHLTVSRQSDSIEEATGKQQILHEVGMCAGNLIEAQVNVIETCAITGERQDRGLTPPDPNEYLHLSTHPCPGSLIFSLNILDVIVWNGCTTNGQDTSMMTLLTTSVREYQSIFSTPSQHFEQQLVTLCPASLT